MEGIIYDDVIMLISCNSARLYILFANYGVMVFEGIMNEEKCFPCGNCAQLLLQEYKCQECRCKKCLRFQAACAAMTGILSNPQMYKYTEIVVFESYVYADALIAELEKVKDD